MPDSGARGRGGSIFAELLAATERAGEIRSVMDAYELMRAIGNLCVGVGDDRRYDARRMVDLLVTGLRQPRPT